MSTEVKDENGMKVAKLICVTGLNNNKYYNMLQINDLQFRAVWGRVEGSEDTKIYEMSKWDSIYKDKTRSSKKPLPYTDVTHLHAEISISEGKKSDSMFHAERPDSICRFVENLLTLAKESVKRNYVISSNSVTKAQVKEAQDVLDAISKMLKDGADIKDINDQLLELYKIIPRKMKKVQDHLLKGDKILTKTEAKSKSSSDEYTTLDDARAIFSNEQDALDVMAGQVAMMTVVNDTEGDRVDVEYDILHNAQLDAYECSPAELDMIKKKMGPNSHQLKRAIRVVNKLTQLGYDKFLENAKNKKTDLLWHGSRNENWWSIFQQGLKIRPSNAVLTGAMFGNGVYFADKAQKSIGYTSLRGSYWSGGGDNSAFLALYEIHQGDQLELLNWKSEHGSLDENKMKSKGKDSVFAKGGADLKNNEYITYNTAQSTIKYLIEIKS